MQPYRPPGQHVRTLLLPPFPRGRPCACADGGGGKGPGMAQCHPASKISRQRPRLGTQPMSPARETPLATTTSTTRSLSFLLSRDQIFPSVRWACRQASHERAPARSSGAAADDVRPPPLRPQQRLKHRPRRITTPLPPSTKTTYAATWQWRKKNGGAFLVVALLPGRPSRWDPGCPPRAARWRAPPARTAGEARAVRRVVPFRLSKNNFQEVLRNFKLPKNVHIPCE